LSGDLWPALAAENEAARMRISAFKSETMALVDWVECSLQVGVEPLPQV